MEKSQNIFSKSELPTEPESKGTQNNQWQVVALELFWVGEAPGTRSQNGSTNKSADATAKMHNT